MNQRLVAIIGGGVVLLSLLLTFPTVTLAASEEVVPMKVQADKLMKQHEFDQAIPLYQTVLEKDKEFANAHYNLAVAYYLKGEIEQAATHLEAFVKLRPEDAEGLYNLACLQLRLGAFEEARESFIKAGRCPNCPRFISRKIKKALHYMKDLRAQSPETQALLAYVVSGSTRRLFAS